MILEKRFLGLFFILFFAVAWFVIFTPAHLFANDSSKVITEQKINKETHKLDAEEAKHELGRELPLWTVIPFIGILLSIAIFPLVAPHFWHHHFPKVSLAWALIFALPFLAVYKLIAFESILDIYLIDYIPFIILLWGLFTIAGGIYLKGTMRGTPPVNLLLILIGTLLASWIGTTGAAMVMIRPLIRANKHRKHKVHLVVFFIFLVANIGGSLTPLGDPPLFLGFLHGVDFFWTLNLVPEMSFVAAILLIVLFLFDSYYYRLDKHAIPPDETKEPIKLEGAFNFVFLLGVILGVIFSGVVRIGNITVLGVPMTIQNIIRDFWIILMGLLSLKFTKKEIREGNEFDWFPIKEVAYLFAGIFMTIIPALAILQAGEHGAMAGLIRAVKEPWHYFWITGSLSSFLDNAPTYLTFFNSALGKLGLTEDQIRAAFAAGTASAQFPEFIRYLTAISIGAVFMGANTYIGNAPNFMVKSIAEESGVAMPSFFGYMFKFSIPILIPTFILVTLVFLR
ncbi:MAG: sodium:proton antiporter [Calditrichaeota bacterium]|nr:sodium:proton antiporter [Calditrichota bacterium]